MNILPRIVGVTGYAQNGKDSLGDMLHEKHGYQKVAFAAALKQMAYVLDPIIGGGIDGIPGITRLAPVVDAKGWDETKQLPEVRRFLQVLGTEAVRDILGADSWLRALWQTIALDPEQKYVVTDVRFPNEEEFVHTRCDGMVFRVWRLNEDGTPFDNGIGTEHPSELHIASLDVDADIYAKDLDELWSEFVKVTGA